MVLSFEQEKELLQLKEQYKEAERQFQATFLQEEHKLRLQRLEKHLEIAKVGGLGGKLE